MRQPLVAPESRGGRTLDLRGRGVAMFAFQGCRVYFWVCMLCPSFAIVSPGEAAISAQVPSPAVCSAGPLGEGARRPIPPWDNQNVE